MAIDKYGHYVNNEGVEINVNASKDGMDHINIYDSCPADNEEHASIHINFDSDSGKGTIVDTTDGEKETTDTQCYLTTTCMRHMSKDFNDKCEELTILRWFRDNFVPKVDVEHYYKTAPIIVEEINKEKHNNEIYNGIYDNVISPCVTAIRNGDFDFAYNKYKNSILILEEQFARPVLEKQFIKVLKLSIQKK